MSTLPEPPEVWEECRECCGQGETVHAEPMVSRWSIDPPGVYEIRCEACGGTGGHLIESDGSSTEEEYEDA